MEINNIQNLIKMLSSNPDVGKAFFGAIRDEEKTISSFLNYLMKEAGLNLNDKNSGGIYDAGDIFKILFLLKDAENISQENDYKISIQKMIKRLNSYPDDAKAFFKIIKDEEKTISSFLNYLMKEAGLNPNDKNCIGLFDINDIFKIAFYLKDTENISQEIDYKVRIQELIKILNSSPDAGKAFFGAIRDEEKTISCFLNYLMKEAGLNPNDKNCIGLFDADDIFKILFYLKDAGDFSQENDYKINIQKMIKRLNSCPDDAKAFFKIIKDEEKTISFFLNYLMKEAGLNPNDKNCIGLFDADDIFKIVFYLKDVEKLTQHLVLIMKSIKRPQRNFESVVEVLNNICKDNYNGITSFLSFEKIDEIAEKLINLMDEEN